MRKLRIAVITVAGGIPALLVSILAPSCGSDEGSRESTFDPDAPFVPGPLGDVPRRPEPDVALPMFQPSRVIELPDAGDAATPEQLCAVQPTPADTTAAARVTLTGYSPANETATGFIAMPSDVESAVVGSPSVSVVSSSYPAMGSMTVMNMTKVTGGFQFSASWPQPLSDDPGCFAFSTMTVAATFDVACGDGGTKTVEARTTIALCDAGEGVLAWVSSGDTCCDCQIIAEMAPSPIVSDKKQDDLPLARVVRLRVLELARAGRQVLLFAENDAGADLDIEWSVSAGSLERVEADLMLWTLPDESGTPPFGQVAVWNDAGAAVENFVWGTA